LASLLSGRSADGAFGALAWHEHLLTCRDCRALLEAEEALEALLASLPEPSLPPALARRVLSRLEPARVELELDTLLDRSTEPEVPVDLARSVLARLADVRRDRNEERVLDELLARVPAEPAPADLARRVLARVRDERGRSRPVVRQPSLVIAPRTSPRLRRALLAASIVVAVGASFALWLALHRAPASDRDVVRGDETPTPLERPQEPSLGSPPDDLLASLDLLESWELVTDDSLELDLTTSEDFDALLMGLEAQDAAAETAPVVPKPQVPKKG
jgi:hypothetical protein